MNTKALLFVVAICFLVMSCQKELNVYEPGNLMPKTVIEDLTLPSVTVNGAKLHSQAFGPVDGTLVICIHGGPGASYRYMLNCKSLADKGYRVVFYDQKGSGLSQRFPMNWYETHNDSESALEKTFYGDLRGIINHYKTFPTQKVVLLGHSWGGMLASGYTGKYPTDISGLIVAEPGGLKWDDVMEYIGNSRSFGLWSEALNDATYVDQFITGKENQHELLDYKFTLLGSDNSIVGDGASKLGANGVYYKGDRNGAVVNAAMFEMGTKHKPDLSEGISQFQKKVLFVYSGNNTAYPDSWAQKISAVYPNKEILKIPGVGHSGMLDQIDTWTRITEPKVIEYLNKF
jgi:proline iminopeptidase